MTGCPQTKRLFCRQLQPQPSLPAPQLPFLPQAWQESLLASLYSTCVNTFLLFYGSEVHLSRPPTHYVFSTSNVSQDVLDLCAEGPLCPGCPQRVSLRLLVRPKVPTSGLQPPAHCYFFHVLTRSLTGLVTLQVPTPETPPQEKHALGRHPGFLPPFPWPEYSANSSFSYNKRLKELSGRSLSYCSKVRCHLRC